MRLITYLSNLMLPMVVFLVFIIGISKRINVYQVFVDGVREGIGIALELLPTLIALFVAVGVLKAGGVIELIQRATVWLLRSHVSNESIVLFGTMLFPICMIPIFLLRLVSSSAATGLLLQIYEKYGTDSLEGIMGSIAMSCTEAVFYCICIYFLSVGITKTRWTLKGAMLSTVAGLVAAVVLANVMVR